MVKIRYDKDKEDLIIYGFIEPNEDIEFKFKTVLGVVGTFQNALDKLDRFNRIHVGWEHISWCGFHALVPDDRLEECIKICEKYKKLTEKELDELLGPDWFEKQSE